MRVSWRGIAAWIFTALACALPAYGFAQSPAPLPNPSLSLLTNGKVNALVRQADGGVIVGGKFTSVNGYGRGNLARLLPNGALDSSWNPNANGEVYCLALDPASGAVYVGGSFTVIGARTRAGLAKLLGSGTGGADASWNPSTTGSYYALAVNAAGDLYVGGYFSSIGGQTRSHLAKLSGSGAGAAYAGWNAMPGAHVRALSLDGGGNLYVAGAFASIGGQTRAGLAKLGAANNGAADAVWNPAPDNAVGGLATDASGAVYARGSFANIGGQARAGLAKLDAGGMGTADASWNPSPGAGTVIGLSVGGDGKIYVSGGFVAVGGQSIPRLARLAPTGTGAADMAWQPANAGIYPINAVVADAVGKAVVGGEFDRFSGRIALAVIEASGTVSGTAIDVEADARVQAVAHQPNGGTVVAGSFLKVNGAPRRYLLRLNADGTLDSGWDPQPNATVTALAADPIDSSIYVAGYLTYVGNQPRYRVAKLSGSGSGAPDPVWNPYALGYIDGYYFHALAVDGAGSLYLGGNFTTFGGQQRNGLAKISTSGGGAVDVNWNPAPVGYDTIRSLLTDGAGHVYVGGTFTQIGPFNRARLAKVASDGVGIVDYSWAPDPNYTQVNALARDGQGSLYVSGDFTSIGGRNRFLIAKLSESGTGAADADWNPIPDGEITTMLLDATGALYVGGWFHGIGGYPRRGLAKLSSVGVGLTDATWNPAPDWDVTSLALGGNTLIVGGAFAGVGGKPRVGLAAVLADPDLIFANSFETGH